MGRGPASVAPGPTSASRTAKTGTLTSKGEKGGSSAHRTGNLEPILRFSSGQISP